MINGDFRVLIDGAFRGNVVNLDQFAIRRTLTGELGCQYLQTLPVGSLEFCNQELYNYVTNLTDTDICHKFALTLEWRCPEEGLISYTPLYFMSASLAAGEVEIDCEGCRIIFSPIRDHPLQNLIEGQSLKVCGESGLNMEMKQYQTGSPILDDDANPVTAPFIRVSALAELISNTSYLGPSGIPPALVTGPFSQGYLDEIRSFTIPAGAAAGGTFQFNLTSPLGDSYDATTVVPAGLTTTQIAQRIANTLNAADYGADVSFNIPIHQVIRRLGVAEVDAFFPDAIRITSHFPWPAGFTFTFNGVQLASAFVQDFQYGWQDMLISPEGLYGERVCSSWQGLFELMCSFAPLVVSDEGPTDLNINLEADKIDTSITPTGNLTRGNTTKTFESELIKPNIRFGQFTEYDDVAESQEGWQWYGQRTAVNTITANVPSPATGQVQFGGCLELVSPATGFYTVQVTINGVPVTSSTPYNFTVGVGATICWGSSFLFPTAGSQGCIAAGANIAVNVIDSLGVDVSGSFILTPNNNFHFYITSVDSPAPFIMEDVNLFLPNENYPFPSFAGCDGLIDKFYQDEYYAGLGYKMDQVLQGLTEYPDTSFITFQDPLDGGRERVWCKAFYFDSSASNACYQENTVEYCYKNLILQHPYIAWLYSQITCSPIRVRAYEFISDMDADEDLAHVVNQVDVQIGGNNCPGVCNYDFSECIPFLQFMQIISENVAGYDFCDSTDTGIIKEMEWKFDGTNTTGIIRGS